MRLLALTAITALLPLPVFGAGSLPEEEMFTFAIVGDTQPEFPWGEWWQVNPVWLGMIEELNPLAPDFVVLSGDQVAGPRDTETDILKMWTFFDNAVAELSPPLKRAVGNHDIWDPLSRRIYEQRYGRSYYSFDHKGCHFAVLDSELVQEDDGDAITQAQVEWLKEDLTNSASARHTFVFLHRPLWEDPEGHWQRVVHPILARHSVDYVYAGHHHIYRDCGEQDGVRYTISGGGGGVHGYESELCGAFHHYNLITVRGSSVSRAVLKSGGVYPSDIVTTESRARAVAMQSALKPPAVDIAQLERQGATTVTLNVPNLFDKPGHLEYAWELPDNSAWEITPLRREAQVPPGQSVELTFEVRTSTPLPSPPPRYAADYTVGAFSAGKNTGELPLTRRVRSAHRGYGDTAENVYAEGHVGGSAVEDAEDCTAAMMVYHDDANLYFEATVADQAIVGGIDGTDGKAMFSGDGVAIVMLTDAPAEGHVWTLYVLARMRDDGVSTVILPERADVSVTGSRTPGGYTVSFIVSRAAVSLPPDASQFRWDFAVNDVDPGQAWPTMRQWNSREIFFPNPAGYGVVELGK